MQKGVLILGLFCFTFTSFSQDVFDIGVRQIEIFFNDSGSPALIKDPGDFDSIFVVMPMKG